MLVAREAVDIASRVSGTLTAIHVQLGDRVARGQKLASLDDESVRHQLRAARAGLKAEQARLAQARAHLSEASQRVERRLPLEHRGVTAEELATARFERQRARAGLALAKAQVASQGAKIVQLEQSLRHHLIRAPFAGRIALRYLDRGAVVERGRPILRLVNSDGLTVRFAVPPARAAKLGAGDPLRFAARGMNVQLDGAVSRIADEVDAAAQMVFVEGTLDKPAGQVKLRAGQVGRVLLGLRSTAKHGGKPPGRGPSPVRVLSGRGTGP